MARRVCIAVTPTTELSMHVLTCAENTNKKLVTVLRVPVRFLEQYCQQGNVLYVFAF